MDNNGKGGARRRQHCWAGLPVPGLTLAKRDWGWLLLHLGQVADYHLLLLGVGVRPPAEDVIPKDAKGVEELKAMLRVGADDPTHASPSAHTWHALHCSHCLHAHTFTLCVLSRCMSTLHCAFGGHHPCNNQTGLGGQG